MRNTYQVNWNQNPTTALLRIFFKRILFSFKSSVFFSRRYFISRLVLSGGIGVIIAENSEALARKEYFLVYYKHYVKQSHKNYMVRFRLLGTFNLSAVDGRL